MNFSMSFITGFTLRVNYGASTAKDLILTFIAETSLTAP